MTTTDDNSLLTEQFVDDDDLLALLYVLRDPLMDPSAVESRMEVDSQFADRVATCVGTLQAVLGSESFADGAQKELGPKMRAHCTKNDRFGRDELSAVTTTQRRGSSPIGKSLATLLMIAAGVTVLMASWWVLRSPNRIDGRNSMDELAMVHVVDAWVQLQTSDESNSKLVRWMDVTEEIADNDTEPSPDWMIDVALSGIDLQSATAIH